MTDDDLFPLMRRSFGSAIVTGASGASMALAFARPVATDALHLAFEAAVEARKAAVDVGRAGMRSAVDGANPALRTAREAKDRARNRALSMLPPKAAENVEAWRHQFIEGEKLAYFGTKRLVDSMEPTRELAWARSQSVLAEAVNAFGEVAETALATSIKFGEELQRGDIAPPKRTRAGAAKPKVQAKKRAQK